MRQHQKSLIYAGEDALRPTKRFIVREDSIIARGVGGHSPSNIAEHLGGIDFPANREELIRHAREHEADDDRHAREHEADDDVLEVLKQMPNRDYGSMADVMKGVGEVE